MYHPTNPENIVKDINKLGLREEAVQRIEKLSEQLEYPVVFWMNAPVEKNTYGFHPENPTQFWIVVRPQTSQEELERLTLFGVYEQVQQRKRFVRVMPTDSYRNDIERAGDSDSFQRAEALQMKINSFASSLINEMHFAPEGIRTSKEVLETSFQRIVNALDEYIQLQGTIKGFHWLYEAEKMNVIDCANLSRRSKRYQYHLEKKIRCIKPESQALTYLRQMDAIRYLIEDAVISFSDDEEKCKIHLLERLLQIMELEDDFEICPANASHAVEYLDGNQIDTYSFVPEGQKKEFLFLRSIRYMNEALGLLHEVFNYDEKCPTARVMVSYYSHCNAYSYMDDQGDYWILVFLDLIIALEQYANEEMDSLNPAVKEIWGIDVRELFFKYLSFFVALHEYGHIINGDCENNDDRPKDYREDRADQFAINLLPCVVQAQYRGETDDEFRKHFLIEQKMLPLVIETAREFRNSVS